MAKGTSNYVFRLGWHRRQAWSRHAEAEGMELSEWVRWAGDYVSGYDPSTAPLPEPPTVKEEASDAAKVVESIDTVVEAVELPMCALCRKSMRFVTGFVYDPGCEKCKALQG